MTHPTDTAKSEELKACPFCGEPAEIERGSDHHGEWFNLGCSRHWGHQRNPDHTNTCIAGRIYYTETEVPEAEAIAAWNRRSSPPQNDAGVEGLRQALKEAREALCNYACHAGPGVPCLRDAYQCEQECGKAAGDAIIAIDAALARTPMSELQALGQEFEAGWRPIETAPKDGSWIITAGGGADFGMPMKWDDRVGAWECDAVMLEDWDNQAEGYSRPTHWFPLPSAPSGGGDSDHG